LQPQGPYLLGGIPSADSVGFPKWRNSCGGRDKDRGAGHARQHVASQWQANHDLESRLGVDDSLILFLDAKEQARQTGKEFTVSAAELQRLGVKIDSYT